MDHADNIFCQLNFEVIAAILLDRMRDPVFSTDQDNEEKSSCQNILQLL